jgi:hypothetical protein
MSGDSGFGEASCCAIGHPDASAAEFAELAELAGAAGVAGPVLAAPAPAEPTEAESQAGAISLTGALV